MSFAWRLVENSFLIAAQVVTLNGASIGSAPSPTHEDSPLILMSFRRVRPLPSLNISGKIRSPRAYKKGWTAMNLKQGKSNKAVHSLPNKGLDVNIHVHMRRPCRNYRMLRWKYREMCSTGEDAQKDAQKEAEDPSSSKLQFFLSVDEEGWRELPDQHFHQKLTLASFKDFEWKEKWDVDWNDEKYDDMTDHGCTGLGYRPTPTGQPVV